MITGGAIGCYNFAQCNDEKENLYLERFVDLPSRYNGKNITS